MGEKTGNATVLVQCPKCLGMIKRMNQCALCGKAGVMLEKRAIEYRRKILQLPISELLEKYTKEIKQALFAYSECRDVDGIMYQSQSDKYKKELIALFEAQEKELEELRNESIEWGREQTGG